MQDARSSIIRRLPAAAGPLREAKQRLGIFQLWRHFGFSGKCGNSCRSPFRDDAKPSFSVSADGMLWHDFATAEGGDSIDFFRHATGLSCSTACAKFIELAGCETAITKPLCRSTEISRQRERPEFPYFEKGGATDIKRLARLRNVSIEGINLASERDLLWFAELRGFDTWIVGDSERVNAQARRMDGGTWEHLDGAKSWTLRGSWAAWLIGAKESQRFPVIALCEGGPDLLAAFHFVRCEDRERDVAPVAMLGAAQRIHEVALPWIAGKRIRIFPHLDGAGQEAAERWTRQLEAVGAEVDAFDFRGLHQTNGEPVGDLNDLSSICPDDFEANRELWGMMP